MESPDAMEALEKLCRAYWYPLYAYARRNGSTPHDAQDLTQGFFSQLLEKNYLAQVGREKGRFRSFMLAAFKHYLADQHDRARAAKRGGNQKFISLDDDAEDRYVHEPATDMSPEKMFERQWALTLLECALARLRAEFTAKDKAETFDAIKEFLNGEAEPGDYERVAQRAGVSSGNLTVMVHRLRKRYRELVRAEIAQTVESSGEVDEEMRHLFAAMSA
jgi:RNA polymerase sigma-70 factor (ECF subfamily)